MLSSAFLVILSVMNDVFLTSWCAKGLKKNVWRSKAASRIEKDGKEGIGGGCHREGPVPRGSRCTEEKTAAKLWAKRLTAYHRLHLKHPSVRESGKAAKTKNLINYDKGTKMTTGTNC